MSKLKIYVYAICKNESSFVDRWMNSMREADAVIVTDTGSTDDTVQRLRQRGAIVYVEAIKPWRFDVARNISLDHVPEDADICVCTDLDEVFLPGWRAKLESAWKEHKSVHSGPVAKTARYLYNWSFKPNGSPDVSFYYFKIHQRRDFIWKAPIHECLHYNGALPLERIYIEGIVLNHYPDMTKSRSSYLPLLELAVEETPLDERMHYYLGREYMYLGKWEQCIETLEAYLRLPTALWDDERCAAMRWIANAYSQLQKTSEAYRWYYRAIAEVPHMRDAYVEFAKLCYNEKDWITLLFMGEEALKIKDKSKTFVNMGYAWDETLNDLCSIAAYQMGLYQRALHHNQAALEHAPNNKRLKTNRDRIEMKLNALEEKL